MNIYWSPNEMDWRHRKGIAYIWGKDVLLLTYALRPIVNFINDKRTNFSYECHISAAFSCYMNVEKQCSYEKCVRKMLMKLTPFFPLIFDQCLSASNQIEVILSFVVRTVLNSLLEIWLNSNCKNKVFNINWDNILSRNFKTNFKTKNFL